MNILDKLSVRTSDYVAAINVSDNVLAALVACSQGVAYSGDGNPYVCRSVKKVSSLEDSAFDKVIMPWSTHVKLGELIRIADHQAMVLVTHLPNNDALVNGMMSYLKRKGAFEQWLLRDHASDYLNLLFKVGKYSYD